MNKEPLTNAGIDYDRGVNRFLGRAQLYDKTLLRFLKDSTFSRIRAAHDSGNTAELLADAHEFKGMCGNIAMPDLYDSSSALVALLRTEDCDPEAAEAAYRRLCVCYEDACAAITEAMETNY